jgi:hypothetical protein
MDSGMSGGVSWRGLALGDERVMALSWVDRENKSQKPILKT